MVLRIGDIRVIQKSLEIYSLCILKAFLDPFYVSGKFVKYKRVGDTLYVNKGLGRINILYHGILLDEEGLPEINDKEAIAIAEYIAYTYKYKEAIRTNN